MNIDIRKLTPNLAEDYARFFDTTPHDDGENKCYCVTWCGDNIYLNGGSHWFPSPMERRAHAVQRVKDGDIQGYLAYRDNRIVGWCNANLKSDCRECINYLRSDVGVPLEECREGKRLNLFFALQSLLRCRERV